MRNCTAAPQGSGDFLATRPSGAGPIDVRGVISLTSARKLRTSDLHDKILNAVVEAGIRQICRLPCGIILEGKALLAIALC